MDNMDWREKLNQFKIPIALSILGLVLIIGGIFTSGLNKFQSKVYPRDSLVEAQKMISVDVSGAVMRSGVYQLKDGSRIENAIAAAGGFTETANTEYVSKYLNMAQKLSDGSKVYVPVAGDPVSLQAGGYAGQGGSVAGINTQAKININTASESDLDSLSGIGPVTASKIISGRPYQAIEDLLKEKIVSKAVFEKIKDQIVVY